VTQPPIKSHLIPFFPSFTRSSGGNSQGRQRGSSAAAARGSQSARVLCIPFPPRAPTGSPPVHPEADRRQGVSRPVAAGEIVVDVSRMERFKFTRSGRSNEPRSPSARFYSEKYNISLYNQGSGNLSPTHTMTARTRKRKGNWKPETTKICLRCSKSPFHLRLQTVALPFVTSPRLENLLVPKHLLQENEL
jgi:hypothetical protein